MAKQSALQRAYNTLRKKKSAYCAQKVNKKAVKDAADRYVRASVSKTKGDKKAKESARKEAKRKANRVLQSGCTMSSYISKKSKTKRRATSSRKTRRK